MRGRCDSCHETRDDLREVVVSDNPGNFESGRPVKLLVCAECYQREGWAEAELTSAHLLAMDGKHDGSR